VESPESQNPITYENQEPITDIEEALQLIRQHTRPIRDLQVHVIDGNEGIRISMAVISGWPEQQIGATKNYHLDEAIFEELKEKGHIQRMSPTAWVSSSY